MKRISYLLTAGVATAALAGPAFAGQAPVYVEGSKNVNSGYSDFTGANIPVGESKVLYVRAKNKSGSNQNARLTGSRFGEASDWQVKYYKGKKPKGSKEITNRVLDDGAPFRRGGDEGFPFSIKKNKSKFFAVKIKHKRASDPLCQRTEIVYNSSVDFTFFELSGASCLE